MYSRLKSSYSKCMEGKTADAIQTITLYIYKSIQFNHLDGAFGSE